VIQKLSRRVSIAATTVDDAYRSAIVSKSPQQFIERIGTVARHAKRARILLLRMVEANYLTIEAARELILQARGLEAIFVASRNTAKRRQAARQRSTAELPASVSRRNPQEQPARRQVEKHAGGAEIHVG
jgi:hypothetical protein